VLLPAAVAAPLLAAALLPLVGRLLARPLDRSDARGPAAGSRRAGRRRWSGRDAAVPAGVVLAATAAALAREVPAVVDGAVLTWSRPWLPGGALDVALRLDALGLLFALVVTVVGVMVMGYARWYFEADDPAAGRTVALLTLFAGAMLGLVLADDVILLFVFWELTSITSFFLIGGDGTKGAVGARRALLVTALGGLALLAGAVLLAQAAGTGSLAGIIAAGPGVRAAGTATAAALLVILAAATKSAQLPFHFWLPGAMVAPTPVSTYLHAATMVKAGVYLLLRFAPTFQGLAVWHGTLVVVGGATAVLGAWVAVSRRDLKALMAYSTVSQLGLLVALIGLGTPLALGTAGLHVLAHALFKAALFMTVGVVDHATGTRDLDRLGGLGRRLPATAAAAALAAAGMAGLPPLLGFVTKEEALAAFVKGAGTYGAPTWTGPVGLALLVAASIGTVAYSLRYVLGTFAGPLRTEVHHRPGAALEAPALLLAIVSLLAGLAVGRLTPVLDRLGADLGGGAPGIDLALWHGVTPVLVTTLAVVAAGLAVEVGRRRLAALLRPGRLPAGDVAFDAVHDGVVGVGARVRVTSEAHGLPVYLAPPLAVAAALLLLGLLRTPVVGVSPTGPALDWGLLALLAAGVLGVTQSRSRIGAVAGLGLVGFLVAGWFVLHGAPDLALTQLLVESLTVALVVVVFRRLPDTFAAGGRLRHGAAGAIAVTVGAILAGTTWLTVGRRGRSDIGDRFLDRAEDLTGGRNVVNTILVDFRALDTLGEVGVLALAAAGIFALVRAPAERPLGPPRASALVDVDAPTWRGTGGIEGPILRLMTAVIAPALLLVAVWLLWRGHQEVGGGFIGGLAAGAAAVLLYLSQGHQRLWGSRWFRTLPLTGAGLGVALAHGFSGLLTGDAFLPGGKVAVPLLGTVARSFVFDVGVFVVVIGMVIGILRHLGQGLQEDEPAADRGGPGGTP